MAFAKSYERPLEIPPLIEQSVNEQLTPSTRLTKLFTGSGCLIRMLDGSPDRTEKEIKAINDNISGTIMVRPSSFIHDSFNIHTYGSGHEFGLFIDPSCAQASYKQMTYSNSIPNIIQEYKKRIQVGKLIVQR